MSSISRRTALIGLGASGIAVASPATAQAFPSQPVKILVPYPPGGGVDTMARAIVERLAQSWGKPVIVENKPGGSTIIGAEFVANATPDGHTLLMTTDSTITSNPFLFKKLPYDPIKQFAPVTQLVDLIQLVLVHRSIAASNGRELIDLAKKNPKALNYASYGAGSQPHLFYEALKNEAGISIEHVPFKGLAPAIQAVVSGETQMTLAGPGIAAGHIKSGAIKAIAVCSPRRVPTLPDVPILAEAGFPDIDPKSWFGLLAPARTPAAIVAQVQKSVAEVLNEAGFKQRVVDSRGFVGVTSTPDAFAKFIGGDMAYKAALIKKAGIKPE